MAEGNPYSFLHISRSEIDLPDQEDPHTMPVYEKAKENLADFVEKGILVREEVPAFYIYRQIMDGRAQTGIVGCAAIDEYADGTIKKHEFTREEKELDRINHFDVCNADTEPVFFTYRNSEGIDRAVARFTEENQPVYNIVTKDGITHILWVVDDAAICSEIEKYFGEIDYMYIADGHHRSASAAKVGLRRREEHPDFDGTEEFNFFMAVVFPQDDLKIFDYNRVVKDLNGYTSEEFIAEISRKFDVSEAEGTEPYRPEASHMFGMYLDGKWYKLRAKAEIIIEDDPVLSLASLSTALILLS